MTFNNRRRNERIMVIPLIALFLSGCQSIPDAPTEVRIPYAVPCISAADMPAKPQLVTDAELLAMPDAAFVIALAADRLERAKYMAATEAVMLACLR